MTPKLYLLGGNGSMHAWWDDARPHFRHKAPVSLELPGFGANASPRYRNLEELAAALLEMTEPGQEIFAVGVNGLVVLHALLRQPGHFQQVYLLAPVGAFLWERSFVKLMRIRPLRHLIHFLLQHAPRLFKRKFSSQNWTTAQYQRMGDGYKACRAFPAYFDFVNARTALNFFETITDRIELIWGTRDAVLDEAQAAAWDSILARAELTFSFKQAWGHYPYIDDPEGFAAYMDAPPLGTKAHTKYGRLALASVAGLPVPSCWTVYRAEAYASIEPQLPENDLYVLRASQSGEDHIDHSQAGLSRSLLRVAKSNISAELDALFQDGAEAVVVQRYVAPKLSGVAFVRHLAAEVAWVEGHLGQLLNGQQASERLILSRMGEGWAKPTGQPEVFARHGLSLDALFDFLQACIRAFHYQHSDIEWAWDGQQFHLFQIRPDTAYLWHRCLTSANLDEILPARVSRIMEYIQRAAAPHIGKVLARWDERVLRDQEPFSVVHEDASYINSDLFLARFRDWGLPGSLYAQEIGGTTPPLPAHPLRFLRALPRLIRMGFRSRYALHDLNARLLQFEQQLNQLLPPDASRPLAAAQWPAFLHWFRRYYLFIVQQNILINTATSSALLDLLPGSTVYRKLSQEASPHRLPFESDPATPRPPHPPASLLPFPSWSPLVRGLHLSGMPGIRSTYIELREWFRDNNMRLFHRVHLALKGSDWLQPHTAARQQHGTFWQDGGASLQQDFSFVIYPGTVEGVVGEDILLVHALEPGHYEQYQRARAVISRTGGRLSHGATLLRELKKPSAIIHDLEAFPAGTPAILRDGQLIRRTPKTQGATS